MRAVMDVTLPARIYAEQVNLLYRNLPVGMFATQVSAFILLAVQWSVIDHGVLLTWFATATLAVLSRMALFAAYRRAHLTQANARRWVVWFTIGTVLAGIIWGSAGIFLYSGDQSHQVFVIFVLAGMTAGAVVSFSSLWKVGLIFIVFTLTPFGAAARRRPRHASGHGGNVAAVHGADGDHQPADVPDNPDFPAVALREQRSGSRAGAGEGGDRGT